MERKRTFWAYPGVGKFAKQVEIEVTLTSYQSTYGASYQKRMFACWGYAGQEKQGLFSQVKVNMYPQSQVEK